MSSQFPHIPLGGTPPRSQRTLNAVMDAARRVQAAPLAPGGGLGVAGINPAIVTVQNNSGADVARFGVLGIDAPVIDQATNETEFYRRIALDCSAPTAGTHEGGFVVTLEPISDGKLGRGLIAGAVQCQVNMVNDADKFAEILDSESGKLGSRAVGSARILWAASGTGDKWAIVQLNSERPRVFAKITASSEWGNAQWVYTITQVTLSVTAAGGTPSAVGVSNVTGGIAGGKALNLAEWAHTADAQWAIDTGGADYPGGFAAQPVGGGSGDGAHAVNDIVEVVDQVQASDGTTFYLIDRFGQHDGTCS